MLNKKAILSNPNLQLQTIQSYYPQADPGGKFFKIREEKTPSAKLRQFKGVWYVKDFGEPHKPQDCFAVVMSKEACNFNKAIEIISNNDNPVGSSSEPENKRKELKSGAVKEQIKGIIGNSIDKATAYLQSRKIDTERLPEDVYFYDKYKNAIVFIDSEKNVLNRRLINPNEGESKARMTKYSDFDPIYDALYDSEHQRVFITEGVIDSLSLASHSSISIFTTSNLIKNPDKLKKYIEGKEVILAFDQDDAGNGCSQYYSSFISGSNIKVQSIKRLLLPQRTDINDLLFDGNLEGFLVDDNNYKVIVDNCSLNETEQQETNEKNEEKPQELTKNQEIEEFIMDRYDVRFNAIKQQPEYCIKNEDKIFQPIDKYVLNSLRRELNQHGLNTSVLNLKSILESDFAKMVHPIREYFNSLPPWDEEADHIKELANTVIVGNPEIWQEYFQKWLVAVVANTLNNQGCQNHTCLVITGKQGAFKTTWLDHLCPKNLSQYLFTGKIDPQNKDSLTYIAECFLINIDDQLRQLNKRDENELKNLITTPFVKYRRPYDIYITEYPHTASFMASVNGNDFLTDPTGSRRFLPFEAIEIDINAAKAIDMDLVYAQAMHLYKSDFRYWFDHKEIEELHTHNQAFQVVSIEEQLVLEYFDKPDERESATDYLQSAVIQSYLENLIRSRLSPKKLGEALTKLGFEKWQRTKDGKTKWVWSVIKKEIPQVDQENNNNPF